MSKILQRRRGTTDNNPQDASIEIGVIGGEEMQPGSHNTAATPVSPSQRQQKRRRFKGKKSKLAAAQIVKVASLISILFLLAVVVQYNRQIHPQLPVADVDIHVPDANDWPLIHIVNTRFMQEQGPLENLGMARFHLFMTFCFPTMVAQSTQKFFWIIKTDPKFTKSPVFDLVLQAAQNVPHKNIYVVASNNNFLQHPEQVGSWVDGAECMDLLTSKIYTGNITKLHMAMALRNERPVLETRLDADDGLHMHYLQYIQAVALQRFKPNPNEFPKLADKEGDDDGLDITDEVNQEIEGSGDKKVQSSEEAEAADEEEGEDKSVEVYVLPNGVPPPPRWLYWCTRRHLEWHNTLADSKDIKDYGDASAGYLAPIQHDKLCVTPGITVGFNAGTDPKTVPLHSHDELVKKVGDSDACFNSDIVASANQQKKALLPCLDLVEELVFCAIRSRTSTSAGMRNVGHVPPFPYTKKLTEKFWQLLCERFKISKIKVKETKEFLRLHQKEIAYENILGQCTTGHSCKDEAKKELQRLMNEEPRA
jgi:hypothetical protein